MTSFFFISYNFIMRARMSRKRKFNLKISYVLGIILFLILFFTYSFFRKFNEKVTPNLINVAEVSINKLNESILMQYRVSNIYKEINLDEVILLRKNTKDEILSVDFKLENAYDALTLITQYLRNNLEDMEVRNRILKYYNEELSSELDSIILSIPIGIASNGIFLANLGPRIPVKVSYMGYLATSVRIKLEDYGINNALVSLYIDCSITNEIIVPNVQKEINHSYSILLASKIIQGTVPDYYGGSYETKSNILNIPIE